MRADGRDPPVQSKGKLGITMGSIFVTRFRIKKLYVFYLSAREDWRQRLTSGRRIGLLERAL